MAKGSNEHPTQVKPAKVFSQRYVRVLVYFGMLIVNVIWWDIFLRNIGLEKLSRRTRDGRYRSWARRYRNLSTELGGIWIKVGQFLSARVDVLPPSIIEELSGLQDEVPAEDFESMLAVITSEFGEDLTDRFGWFDSQPLASASLGQVHRARLPDGSNVVVKVQRPKIEEKISIDLAALHMVIRWLKRFRIISRRANLDALFAEFSRTVWEEVDYLAEAENASRFKEMFSNDPEIRIPGVYHQHTTKRVLTLEDVYFIKITDYQAIENAGVNLAAVADRLFHTYLRQIFEEGFFHADPHPGNLFVEPLPDGDWRLIFVDFGMVGHLSPEAKDGLRELAIAVATKDLDRVISAYQMLDMLLPGANLERIREAEALVFERFWGMSMRELTRIDVREMHQFAHEYRDLLFELPFQVPSDLIFLVRCLAILSGMCTGLYPDFNLFEALMPFASKLLMDERESVVREVLNWLEKQARIWAALPERMSNVLRQVEKGELLITAKLTPQLERKFENLATGVNRLVAAVVFTALLLGGSLLYLGGERWLGGGFLCLSILTLWWVLKW
jgi:predicted unusual protein kinase regulating ubiquinone biosynthesis (AarF/ABC1/UbiB family)